MARFNTLSVGTLTADKIVMRTQGQAGATVYTPAPKVKVKIFGPILSAIVNDAAVQKMITLPKGFVIEMVNHQIIVAMTKVAHSIIVGSLADDNGWLTTTDIGASALAAGIITTAAGADVVLAKVNANGGLPLAAETSLYVTHSGITGAAETGGTHRLIVEGYLPA